jgi:hypothetical protein
MQGSSQLFFPYEVSHHNPARISLLSHECHMPRPSYMASMKLLVMQMFKSLPFTC